MDDSANRKDRNKTLLRVMQGALRLLIAFAVLGNPPSVLARDTFSNLAGVQEPPKDLSPEPSDITKKIADLELRIDAALQSENSQTAQQPSIPPAELSDRTAKLRSIQAAYERSLTAQKKKRTLEEEAALLREKLQKDTDILPTPPPYSLGFYDNLLDELSAFEQQKEMINISEKISKRTLEDLAVRLENIQKGLRRDGELLTSESNPTEKSRLSRNLEKERLEKEYLDAALQYEKINRENLLTSIDISQLREALFQKKVAWARDHIFYDEKDYKSQVDTLIQKRASLEKQIQETIPRQEKADKKWISAQKSMNGSSTTATDPVREAHLNSCEAWHVTYQSILEQMEDQLQLLAHQERIWKFRYAVVKGGISRKDLETEETGLKGHVSDVARMLDVRRRADYNTQAKVLSLEKAASEKKGNPSIVPHLKDHIKALQKKAERQLQYTAALLTTEKMDRRTLDEIARKLHTFDFKQGLATITSHIQNIWDFEITAIDNNAITVKKLVIAFIILVVGLLAAKFTLRIFTRRLFSVIHLQETTTSAMNKVLTYTVYVLVLLFALRMVNIPLTVFAFVGGAIAIGVGFGAQNLINNFISGFIIMGERPIRIGDLVEFEGVLGKVEEVGARCTRVRTGENIRILVPNSSLLEKNITNWTLSDRKIRTKVTVGIVYGSPVREAEQLLLKAVSENKKVFQTPPPFVIFADFGDNALIFEVFFWIEVASILERRLIESSVRFRIDELFREAGITIAFPQRDVHLDTTEPLSLRLLGQEKKEIPNPQAHVPDKSQ